MNDKQRLDEPWYRNQWVWLVISIPSLTVVGCMLTIWLAITHPDTLVKDPVLDREQVTRTPREALP